MSNNTLDEHGSQIPALYPEIIEDILRHLESDKAALMACALVSRTWVYTTRRHLFRNLQIREAQPDLVPFLANTPTISRHIQELRLGHSSPVVKSRHRLNTTTIRDILRNLPALTSLTLDGGFWEVGDFGVDSDSFADTRFRTFTQLQSLTLTRVLIGGAVHAGIEGLRYNLHRLLVLFPCLRRISLLQTWVGDDWHLNELTNDLLSPLNLDLEFLVIHTTQSTASLLNFFQVSHCTRSLRRLDITCPEPTHLSPFREFISEVGSHITHLRLDLTCAIEWVVDESE